MFYAVGIPCLSVKSRRWTSAASCPDARNIPTSAAAFAVLTQPQNSVDHVPFVRYGRILTFAVQTSEKAAFVLTCISLFLLSAVLRSVRSKMKSECNRLLKRVFRVGGFALAPLAAVIHSAIPVLSSVVAFSALHEYNEKTVLPCE